MSQNQSQLTVSRSTHDGTEVSKKNRKIEAELARRLNEVVDLIKRLHVAGNFQTGKIRSDLEREVYILLRSRVEKSYSLGVKYVSDSLGRPAHTSVKDTRNMDQIASEFAIRFWGRIDTLILDKDLAAANIGITTEKTNNFVVTSIAADLTTRSLNDGTLSKTRELVSDSNNDNEIVPNPDADPLLFPNILGLTAISLLVANQIEQRLAARNPTLFGLPPLPVTPGFKLQLQWVITLTDRTCNQCKALNGLKWDIGDPTIPTPGGISNNMNHTHFNCRCRLMLVETAL